MNYTILNHKIYNKLNPLQAYIYCGLCFKTDFKDNTTHIAERTLAEFTKVDKMTVDRTLDVFETENLVSKDSIFYGNKKVNTYTLNRDIWFAVNETIWKEDLTREQIGFLLLLRSVCVNNTYITFYNSSRKLAEVMKLGKSQINEYLKVLEEKGYITKDKVKIEIVRTDLFKNTTKITIKEVATVYYDNCKGAVKNRAEFVINNWETWNMSKYDTEVYIINGFIKDKEKTKTDLEITL